MDLNQIRLKIDRKNNRITRYSKWIFVPEFIHTQPLSGLAFLRKISSALKPIYYVSVTLFTRISEPRTNRITNYYVNERFHRVSSASP